VADPDGGGGAGDGAVHAAYRYAPKAEFIRGKIRWDDRLSHVARGVAAPPAHDPENFQEKQSIRKIPG
jgi:hypothetical protein